MCQGRGCVAFVPLQAEEGEAAFVNAETHGVKIKKIYSQALRSPLPTHDIYLRELKVEYAVLHRNIRGSRCYAPLCIHQSTHKGRRLTSIVNTQ